MADLLLIKSSCANKKGCEKSILFFGLLIHRSTLFIYLSCNMIIKCIVSYNSIYFVCGCARLCINVCVGFLEFYEKNVSYFILIKTYLILILECSFWLLVKGLKIHPPPPPNKIKRGWIQQPLPPLVNRCLLKYVYSLFFKFKMVN